MRLRLSPLFASCGLVLRAGPAVGQLRQRALARAGGR
jgi:hypothetical protein